MRKTVIFACAMLVLIFFISSCAEKTTQTADQTKAGQQAQKPASESLPEAKSYSVEIRSSGFRPETIEISLGDSVTWTNYDSKDHTISGPTFPMPTSTSPKTSGRLQPGESWTKRFDSEGYFAYADMYDSNFKGKVVVK